MASSIDDTNSSQWALLPNDVLYEITHRLYPSDYVRFGAVCKSWLSFAHRNYKQKHLLHTHQNLPLLLIPTESHQERRGLYNVTKGMIYDQFQLHLPHKRCCGSSYGWLFFVANVNESKLELILLNPFLGDSATIKLPPLQFCDEDEVHMMDHYGVQKAILSRDPYVSPHDYEVIALYGSFSNLAYYKSGDKFWSYAKKVDMEVFADVIFYKNLILVVDRYDWIVNFTLQPFKRKVQSTNCSPWYMKRNTISKQLPLLRRCYAGNAYLVENSKGDLLLARRYYWDEDELEAREAAEQEVEAAEREGAEDAESTESDQEVVDTDEEYVQREYANPHLTVKFKVYRLCFPSTRKQLRMKKIRMKTLHGETLILGDNHSISVLASKYSGLCPNSIYYTDDFTCIYPWNLQFGSCDTGIFDIEDESFGKHFVPSFSTKGMPPPIFVVPR